MNDTDSTDPCFARLARRGRDELRISAAREKITELRQAYERGREDGRDLNQAHWIAGAKVGAFCGALVGLAVGAVGAAFWIRLAVAS